MSQAYDAREIRLAYRIRRTLDESASQLPPGTAERLASARQLAMSRKKAEAHALQPAYALAGAPGLSIVGLSPHRRAPGLFQRLGLLWPMLALVIGLMAIGYWERQQRIADLADIDAAVLSDELPLSAYLDHGFDVYLKRAQ